MRYLVFLLASFLGAALIYFSPIFLLFPSPITAEYWVREMLVMKRNIAKEIGNQKKIVIAGGSSVLFGVDTNEVGRVLGLPAINFGLMAGLSLDTVFHEINGVVNNGDILVLALEPDYYCREADRGYDEWQIRNAIAWDYQYWRQMPFLDKVASIRFLSPLFPIEMITARIDLWRDTPIVRARLAALEDALIIKKYTNPEPKTDNLYSIENIDGRGNLRSSDEASYTGNPPSRADQEIRICDGTFKKLNHFVRNLQNKNIAVFFMNPPYMQLDNLDYAKIIETDNVFIKKLTPLGPVLDRKSEILVPRDNFLNSDMHLNNKGRAFRTRLLIERLSKYPPFSK
jgi:hypothetical protein